MGGGLTFPNFTKFDRNPTRHFSCSLTFFFLCPLDLYVCLKVVPVPAVFTRGRWECIDYKDGASAGTGPVSFSIGGDNQTIEFDKSSASQTPLATQTNVHVGEGVGGAGQQQIGGFCLIFF